MKAFVIALLIIFAGVTFNSPSARSDEFQQRAAKIAEYKKWLDTLDRKDLIIGCASTHGTDHIDYISVRVSIVPTSKARSVS